MLRRLICFLILLPTLSLAIELGSVEVQTPLYQPLRATIALQQLQNIPVKELQATLASQHEFKEAGLVKTHLLQQLQFAIKSGKKGDTVISITSAKPIQEPYISFLLKLSWLQGDYIKKYTLLLDPPAQLEATTQAKTTLTIEKPHVKAVQHTRSTSQRVYGPTKHYETLWQVAKKLRPNKSVTLPQTMVAIASLNPNAFQRHNINGLMSGFHLKVPSLEQIQSIPKAQAERDLRQHKSLWKQKKTAKLHKLPVAKIIVEQPKAQPSIVAQPITTKSVMTSDNKAMEPSEAVMPKVMAPHPGAIDVLPPDCHGLQQQLQKALSDNKILQDSNQKLQEQVTQLQQQNKTLLMQSKPTSVHKAVPVPATEVKAPPTKTIQASQIKPQPLNISKTKPTEPGMLTVLMDFWWQIVVILALLLFLIIWRIMRKRKSAPKPSPSPDTPPDDFGPDLETEIVNDEEASIDIHTIHETFEEPVIEEDVDVNSLLPEVTVKEVRRKKAKVEIDAASPEEVLHEARLYIDYGRNDQVKEMLQSVAASEPEDEAIWKELLTLYASLDDNKGLTLMFTKISPDLLKDEKSSLWKKIELLRKKDENSATDIVASAITEDTKTQTESNDTESENTTEEILIEEPSVEDSIADVPDTASSEEQIELTLLDESSILAANDIDTIEMTEPLGGEETQLDLATAYLAMDNHKGAKKILQTLAQSDDANIKAKAEALLEKIKD